MKIFKIENDNLKVELLDYGATIYKFIVKNKNRNIVLTNKDLFHYVDKTKGFLGLTIGPVTNRISNGYFVQDGKKIKLDKNENNKQTLHSGNNGFDNKTFKVIEQKDNSITFFVESHDDGFLGNKEVKVIYKLTNNSLRIDYEAVSDFKTPFNITNHSYFNLNGSGDILNHQIMVNSDSYLELDNNSIPTGKISSVINSNLDFTSFNKVSGVLDNHFIFKDKNEMILKGDDLTLIVKTSYPGIQLYNSAFATNQLLDDGSKFTKYKGLAIEPQFEVDAVNNNLRNIFVEKDQVFKSFIEYTIE